jgi:uncharacterized protein (TIGR02217 family)
MASFHDAAIFPQNISYGSQQGTRFSTSVIKLRSGAEERVARWSYPLHVYDVGYGLRSYTDVVAVRNFFIARLGPAHGFRFKDPLDFSTATPYSLSEYIDGSTPTKDDVVIGTGDASEVNFQLVKKYTEGGITRVRNITKPINGTVLIAIDGVLKTETTDYTIDYTTGVVTFGTAPPSGDDVSAGFEFHVPVSFSVELDEGLLMSISSFGGGSIPSIPLMEELQPGSVADEFYYGQSGDFAFGADISISANAGRAIRLAPSTSGLDVSLPDTTDLAVGGPWFFFVNISGSQSVTIKDDAGTTVFTLAANSGATIVPIDVSGVKTWEGF